MSKLFFILLLIFCSRSFAQSEEDISELRSLLQGDLPVVEKIAEDLMRVYSPEKYVYVTIGSSPVVLQAYFATNYPLVEMVNLPLTGLGGGYTYAPTPDLNLEKLIIERRLRNFVGTHRESPQVGIVLIDYVNTGRTLLRVLSIAQSYLRGQQVETYALFRNETQKTEWAERGQRGIVVGTDKFGIHLHKTKYNPWSEYMSLDYRKNQTVKNAWYSALINEMTKLSTGLHTSNSCALLF